MKKAIVLIGIGLSVLLAGGATAQWFPQNSTLSYTLRHVDFTDTLNGVVTGIDTQHSDTGLVTTNGGMNWIRMYKPGGFGPVCMVNERRGFSTANTFVTTTDGGFSWVNTGSIPYGIYVRGLSYPDTLHGWAAGENGSGFSYIIVTTDGGYNWTKQDSVWGNYFDVMFRDTLHGWVTKYSGGADTLSVVATRDGGKTWVKQRTPDFAPATDIFFLDTLRGWVIGDGAPIVGYTTNGGQRWDWAAVGHNLCGVVFADSLYGWVVGIPRSTAAIDVSTDGGRSWSPQTPGTSNILAAVDFVGRRKGWIVGVGGVILHTDNGGGAVGVEGQPESRKQKAEGSIFARPNPSKGAIWLRIRVTETSLKNTESRLRIYDMSGRLVRDLTQGLRQGHQEEVLWDGRDEKGKTVPSGTYVAKLKVGDKEQERKVVVVR